jgi:hypothetical protein
VIVKGISFQRDAFFPFVSDTERHFRIPAGEPSLRHKVPHESSGLSGDRAGDRDLKGWSIFLGRVANDGSKPKLLEDSGYF